MPETAPRRDTQTQGDQFTPLGPLLPAPMARPAAVIDLAVTCLVMHGLLALPRAWLCVGLDPRASDFAVLAGLRSRALDAGIVVLLALALLRLRRLSFKSLGLSAEAMHVQVGIVLPVLVCMYAYYAAMYIGDQVSSLTRPAEGAASEVAPIVNDWITNPSRGAVLLTFLFGAIMEETLFRGLILRYLVWLLRDPPIAVILSALLFAAPHISMGAWTVTGAMWMGLVLGTVYVRRGSLLTVIIVHFLYNVLETERVRLMSG